MKKGFDNEKYLATQSRCIRERIDKFGDKLYLEFGGKLFDDYHASRVLPGFEPDSKLQLLMQLSEHAGIVIVISAVDIEKNKIRGDLGITYDTDVLRLIALSISAATHEDAALAMKQLPKLAECQAHTSVMLSPVDIKKLKQLGIQFTMEAKYENNKNYH